MMRSEQTQSQYSLDPLRQRYFHFSILSGLSPIGFFLLLLMMIGGNRLAAQNPITGNQGFQILSEGNFTLNNGPHIHGPLGVGGNLIINTPSMAEVNMDNVGSYVFPGDGSTSTGLMVKGGITWTTGYVSVKSGKYIHIGNSTGCIQSDNGTNMSTQVLPTATSYNNAKRIEGTIDQTPSPSAFQSVGFDFTGLFTTYRSVSDGLAACTNNVQLYNASNVAISGNTVSSAQNVQVNALANGVNHLDLTQASLNNITELKFNAGALPSATKLLVISVPLTSNFVWNNSNLPALAGATNAQYIIWNFSGSTTYNLTVNTASLIVGTIFAPNHNLIKTGTGDIDGNLIAKTITIGIGEIHFYPFNGSIPLCSTCSNLTSAGTIGAPQTGCAGGFDPSTLTETAAPAGGTGTIEYQWQSSTDNANWSDISGATAQTYDPPILSATTYFRRGVRRAGCTTYIYSASVTMTAATAISITTQPVSATIASGGTQTLTVAATGGTPSLTYQWQSSTDNITFANISGATSASYTTPALTTSTFYKVIVSASGNGCGSVTSATAAVAISGPSNLTCTNFLCNPEFDYGTNKWSLWSNTGNTATLNVNTGSQLSGTNSGFIDISSVVGGAANAWQIQLVQTGFAVYSGTTYTVSFQAKAAANRNIYVTLQQSVSPYTTYAAQTVALTTTKNTYTLTLPVSTTDLNMVGLYFNLGESVADVYLDNVVWSEQCGTQACINGTGHNTISNPEMDFGTNNWGLSVQGGASATSSIVNTNQLSGANSVFVNIATATGTNWHVQLLHPGHTVEAGKTYKVTFKAKATANRNMYVSLQQNHSPWSEIDGSTVALTTASQNYSLIFTATQTDNNDIGLYFHLGESSADVYIDAVTLAELCNTEICNNGYDDDGDGLVDGADSECSSCDAPTYGFQNGTLESGSALSPGAVYLFQNVTPGTDVRLKINSFSHPDVQISNIDLSSYDAPGGYNLAFQPQVLYGWNNGNGTFDPTGERFVNFTFSFYDAGTLNPQEFNKLVLSAVDVDGDNGSVMEFIESSGFSSYETNSPTALTLSGALKAKSNISNGTNIDETLLDHMISYTYQNKTSINVKYGADWNGASNTFADNRLNSMYFKCYSLNTQVACPTVAISGPYSSVCTGVSQTLTSTITGGSGTKTYQWQSSTDNSTWTNISGATGSSYTTPGITAKTYYRLGVNFTGNTNCGTVYSDDFPITPGACVENCSNGVDDNGNGLVDGADLDCVTLCATGSLNFQRWLNIGGSNVSDLTGNINYPNNPTTSGSLTSFDGPDNVADDYGTRVRGYITPSVTGNYIFNLTSDDGSQLFLSTNANPANKALIASVNGWTSTAEYNKYSAQTSSPYYLLAGRNYYVELLQKEGGGLDHFQVYWKTPSNSTWTIIPGANLRPFNCAEICGNTLDDDGNGLADCAESICQPTISSHPTGGTICTGGTYTLSVTAQGSPTYQWQSSTNNSTFTNIAGATLASYTTPVLTTTTYYRVVVTSSGCPKNSISATVTMVADPTITAQPASASICSGATQTLTVTATGGTPSLAYQWQSSTDNVTFTNIAGATSASYTTAALSATTYYKVLVSASGNGCGTATSSVATISISAGPSITTQPSGSTICTGGTATVSVVASNATGYQWQSSTDNVTFTNIAGATSASYTSGVLTATTYYKVVVNNGSCGSVTSSAATVTVVADPAITAQPASATICSGATQTLSVTATGGTPSLTYQWQSSTDNVTFANIAGATSASYTTPALAATTYYKVLVSASGNGCGSATSSVATVTVAAVPTITTQPASTTICTGITQTLSVVATGGTPSLTYQWQTSPNGSSLWTNILGATSGNYTTPALLVDSYYRVIVSASGSGCASVTSSVATISMGIGLTPIITGGNAICSGSSTTLSTSGGSTYLWSTGASTASIVVAPSTATTYTVTVTNVTGCTGTAQTTVTVNPLPTVTSTGTATICQGVSTNISAAGAGGSPPYTYAWSNSLGAGAAKVVSPATTTTYIVTVTSANTCTATGQVTITVNPAPVANAGIDATICEGTSATLTATGGTTYAWSNSLGGGASKTVSPITTTTYTVTVTNAQGCTATDQVVVNVNAAPVASAGSNIAICNGSSTTLTASASGGVSPYTYAWNNALGSGASKSVNPIVTTTYIVTVTGSNGCTSTAQATVTLNAKPTASAGPDVTVCPLAPTTLTATGSGAPSPYSFAWSNGVSSASQTVTPLLTTTYTVTVTSSNGCFATATKKVTVGSCAEICNNLLDDDGDGLADCADSDCGPTANAGSDISICPGTPAFLSVGVTGGSAPYTYAWSNGLGTGASKTVSPLVTTTYSVTVTSASGCTNVDQIKVTVNACSENCTNNIDDDGDGLVDCADPDCSGVTAPILVDDNYTTCPGLIYSNRVTYNDGNLNNPAFSIAVEPLHGTVTIDWTGKFVYTPNTFECLTDQFTYQVCNLSSGCCETAVVSIILGDNTLPVLTNVPADLTISCDDAIPPPSVVTAFDQCPGIYMDFDEASSQNYVGACGSYTITRTWTATDFCGNAATDNQIITVLDQTKPEIFQLYTLDGGAKMVAGFAQRVTHDWKYVRFPITFKTAPVVLASISTATDGAAVVTQMRNVSMQGFEIRLREEEAFDGKHGNENVSWVAIDAEHHDGNLKWEAGSLANVKDVLDTISFVQTFNTAPLFFASSMSNGQSDPATLRLVNLSNAGAEIILQEEQSADAEIVRTSETVGYLALKENAAFVDIEGNVFGEAGRLDVTNAWATVNLTRRYTKPVVIVSGVTNHDNQPVTLRVRNVTASKFEVRLQEWGYLDGNHPAESISWVVVEGSVPGNISYYCSGSAKHLKPNFNLFAVDNCDDLVTFGDSQSTSQEDAGVINSRTWTAIDDCGNTTLISRNDTCQVAALKVKGLLYGAMTSNGGGNIMRDNLRTLSYVPTVEPYSQMPSYPYVKNDNAQVTVCHNSGQPNQQTLTINLAELQTHLDHGDVLGECLPLPPPLPANAASATYHTIANGIWTDPATWKDGLVPALNGINGITISIEHIVTLQSGDLNMKTGSKLWVTNGSLVLKNGNLKMQGASLFAFNSLIDISGTFYTWTGACELIMKNCEVKTGLEFSHESGKRKLENVCVNTGTDFTRGYAGVLDTLINVTATINGDFKNWKNGSMYVSNSKFRILNGSFTNSLGNTITGNGLTVLVENGGLLNLGLWNVTVAQYCVSGLVSIPTLSLPATMDCANIFNWVASCSMGVNGSDDDDDNSGGGGSSGSGNTGGGADTGGPVSASEGVLNPPILQVTGNDAIVDWLLLELRSYANEAEILGYATVLLKRDGRIMSESGDSIIVFPGLDEGDYYVSLRHRNHLGLMTNTPVFLTITDPPMVDFTDPNTAIKGGLNSGKINAGKRTLWGGDFNSDGRIIYQGPNNDVFYLFTKVVGYPENTTNLANFIVPGYELQDYNLDGKVIYQGPLNDRGSMLFGSILGNPGNVALLANYITLDFIP